MSPKTWIRRGAAAAAASAALMMAFQPAATAAPDGQYRHNVDRVRVKYSPHSKQWRNGNDWRIENRWRYRSRWTPPAPETNQAPEPNAEPQAKTANSPDPAPAGDGSFADRIVELTNAERAKEGLAPLERDDCLTRHAQNWSNHMSSVGRMYHSNLREWMRDCSLSSAGENVAYGGRSPEETVRMWMGSPGHRANILNGRFTKIGVGVAGSENYSTQAFGS